MVTLKQREAMEQNDTPVEINWPNTHPKGWH